jgi:hypothetical protein
MNKLVKSTHVDANTPLHQFAKQMMKLLHSRKMKEAKEALGCMVSDKMNNICLYYLTKTGNNLVLHNLQGQKDTTTLFMFEIRVVREGVNLARPDKAKPKGRTIKSSEQRGFRLGVKGAKKMSRKCQKCGIADGHNSRTCLTMEDNRIRLANLAGRKRGRPPGSRNKIRVLHHSGMRHQRQKNERCMSKMMIHLVESRIPKGYEIMGCFRGN